MGIFTNTITAQGQSLTGAWFLVRAGTNEIKVTLAWDDQAAAGLKNPNPALINDLDLSLHGPAGQVVQPFVLNPAAPGNNAGRAEDHTNVVEQVLITKPQPGFWFAQVKGTRLPQGPQLYALVAPRGPADHLAIGQFNSDALPDVYLHWRDGANRLYINQGRSFREIVNPISIRSINPIDGEGVDHLAVGDFNGDK
jgi:hypothetical protein